MHSVLIVPTRLTVLVGASNDGKRVPTKDQVVWRDSRPAYLSQQEARAWVGAGDATWDGNSRKRIRLTKRGELRFLEISATPSMSGNSNRLGAYLAGEYASRKPWAVEMVGDIRSRKLRLPVTTAR